MRISEYEKSAILEAVKDLDPLARVWLFGSRTDDNKKGGDIDIAILSEIIASGVMQKIKLRRAICGKIGEQKLDIVASPDGNDPFFRLAVAEGIQLT